MPNEYEVYLSPGDYEQLSSFEGPLVEDLASYLVAYAKREGWTLVASADVTLHSDDDLPWASSASPRTWARGRAPRRRVALAPPPVGNVVKPPPVSQTIVFQPPAAAPRPPQRRRLCGVLRARRARLSTSTAT